MKRDWIYLSKCLQCCEINVNLRHLNKSKTMKKEFLAAICCIVVALLTGCQQAEEIKGENEKLRMSIEASVGQNGDVAGRTALGDGGAVSFSDDDEIGLSVNGDDFVKWTYDKDDNKWGQDEGAATLYWNGKGNHQFCAFYPFVSGATLDDVPMPDLTKQTGEKNKLGTFDFLTATKVQGYGTNGVVSLAFDHQSSLVVVTLKGEGDLLSTDDNVVVINKISISGTDIATSSACQFTENGSMVVLDSENEKTVDVLEVSMATDYELTAAGATFYFVVNAGTVDLEDADLSIEYISGDKTYVATLYGMGDDENSDVAEFVSGKQYSYALKVVSGEIVVSGNSISEWSEVVKIDDVIIGVEQAESES